MGSNECQTMIAAARNVFGHTAEKTLRAIDTACDKFAQNTEAASSGAASTERFGS